MSPLRPPPDRHRAIAAVMLDQDGLPIPRRHIATLAIMATLVLVVLDSAIANVALPTLATTLDVQAAASIWW